MGWLKEEEIKAKKDLVKAKATTYLIGENKVKFFDDILKTGKSEAKLLQEMVNFYYEHKPSTHRY